MSEKDATRLIRSDAVAVAGRSEIVWVTGPDAVRFLDGLLSQNLAAMAEGTTARSLLLAPNGKLRATLLVLRGGEQVGLVCDAGRAEVVRADLSRFKIRVDAAISVEERPVVEVWGVNAAEHVAGAPEAGRWVMANERVSFRMPFAHSSVDRIVVVGWSPSIALVDTAVVEPFRIEVGEPVMGTDLTEKTIPQEAGDINSAVDFTKGCYLGQELVARIDSRGHVNRRLAGLVLDGESIPEPGKEISRGDRSVGEVTSAVWSVTRGSVLALGMVRVEVEAGESVSVAGGAGVVSDLPMYS
ncbi:MAG: glycine cleavage T C-terminal barrel domain-containing protein [Acidimicrobiia bacterium]|nr:glycine cleavage T C-terminal barrel domain-containing protein [Acidimicrobiia bacterium]